MKEEIYDIKLMLSQTNYETSFNANATCSHRLLNYITSIEEENQKLNNIINELEIYLNKVIETSTEMEKITCSFVLQYLQKLKESDR